jgi:DNA-binding XRE family transcriptional regulator
MNKKLIAKRLVELRERKKITRIQAAKDLEISKSTLQMYENGKRVPKDEIKLKIADYYDSNVQDIFFEN